MEYAILQKLLPFPVQNGNITNFNGSNNVSSKNNLQNFYVRSKLVMFINYIQSLKYESSFHVGFTKYVLFKICLKTTTQKL